MEVRKTVKEMEQQIEGVQNEKDFAKMKSNFVKLYNLISRKMNIGCQESDDQNEQKWIRLAQEYSNSGSPILLIQLIR